MQKLIATLTRLDRTSRGWSQRRLASAIGFVGSALIALVALAHFAFAADTSYALSVTAPPTQSGQRAIAKIKITPSAGYHMNKEYPMQVALMPPPGVTFEKVKLTSKDAARLDEQSAEFDVVYTAAQSGKRTITGEIRFAVCSASSCDPKRSPLNFVLEVR
jgi:hypothetical protein